MVGNLSEGLRLVQTFLPYPDVMKSLRCLDWRRLGKQRSEAKQLIKSLVLEDPSLLSELRPGAEELLAQKGWIEAALNINPSGWKNHPARNMWRGHLGALAIYHDSSIIAWRARGYENNMPYLSAPGQHKLPPWFGREDFHASHRGNLLRKDPVWYGQFGWTDSPDLEYVWPSKELT
jgi:hypothetical protein